jgi:hypothetical protein
MLNILRTKISFLIILFSLSGLLKGQEKYSITFDYRDLTFDEFVIKAENQTGVRFFYKPEWVSGLRFSLYKGCTSLNCVLDSLFRKASLNYIIDEAGRVIITGKYKVKILDAPQETAYDMVPLTMFINSTRDQGSEDIKTITIGNVSEKNRTGNVSISGYILNRDTRAPVEGVNIYIQKLSLGAITNEKGYYSLSLPRGVYQVIFSYIGMLEKKVNLNLYGQGQLNIDMDSKLIPLKEIVVSSNRNVTIERMEVGAEKINIPSFSLLPTSLGEADIIKNLNMIPGVQSLGEGSAGFNVRGGSEDQNLILLYGAPVYNSSHFFGFFSSVNSDIIKDATLYKGGIPSRYGGRISSVLDIESKDGNNNEFAGNAGISPIAAHVVAEGPIIKDTLSYMLNLRATYSNWLMHLIKVPALENSEVSFNDFNGRITYKINKSNKLDLSAYLSGDSFHSNFNTHYTYGNNIVALKWQHNFDRRLYFNLSLNNSFYKYRITDNINPDEAYVLSHRINSTGTRADLTWMNGRNEINSGIELNYYSVLPGSLDPSTDSSLVSPKSIGSEKALESGIWIDDKLKVTNFLSVNAGLRFSSFLSFGPQDVLEYGTGYAKMQSSVTDTLHFGSLETTSRYGGPELRLSVNFRISRSNSVKFNYNRTRQYIHLLSNTYSISPTATWKLCDAYLKPEIGDQYAIGLYQIFSKAGMEISAEAYYKEIKNLIDFKGGSTLTMAENIEQYLIDAKGKAYGIELSLKKMEGKLRYSVGYAYARSLVKSLGIYRDDIINSGEWYPSNYDKPNNFIVTLQYLYSRRFSFSADYTYSTGRPVTFPLSTYYLNDILMVQYSDRNKYRIPDYSRLDISVKISGNLKSHRIAHPWWIFSIYNLAGNENAYSVYFVQNGSRINGYKLSVFGRAFPSVTFSFDF